MNPLHSILDAFSGGGRGTPPYAGLSCERSGRQATGRSGGLARFSLPFSRLFYIRFFFFSIFYILVTFTFFCEEGVKMCFFLFWLFSAVFLCGQFQYDVKNRWNSAVFVFSTVFVWTIPVCVILTKVISVTFACSLS